jgi:uncharacterized protein YfiM (DUF2279 family)
MAHLGNWHDGVAVIPAVPGLAGDDEWTGDDKAFHFGASLLIDTAGDWALREGIPLKKTQSLAIAGAATLTLGAAIELTDEEFSEKDLAWDIAGTAVGMILWMVVDRRDDRVTLGLSSSFTGIQYLRRF